MYIIKLFLISIFNVMRLLYLPIAFIHSVILYLLLLTDKPLEDVDYYCHLIHSTTKYFTKE